MKTEKNIRKIEELDNPLFDLKQYRVNLEFIYKSKNIFKKNFFLFIFHLHLRY